MKRIIYVEDDMDTANAVKLVLESAGFEVDTALTGDLGLKMIKENNYDLALLDIMMPDMSGWDLYQHIKNNSMKFAFLSALPITEERLEELRKEGISDYITKPFAKKDLIERVKKMLDEE